MQQHRAQSVPERSISPFHYAISLQVVWSGVCFTDVPTAAQFSEQFPFELRPLVCVDLFGQAEVEEYPFL